MRQLPSGHRGEERALSALLAAGGTWPPGWPAITLRDFAPTGYWQLSLTGMTRLGHTRPVAPIPSAEPTSPLLPPDGIQLELCAPGESRLFDKRHWVASNITNEALLRTRRIAGELAETRGWNDRIVVETNRALAVVLAAHQTGDLIAWSQLSPALRSRDLSVTRTAEILGLAGLLNDDRVSSFDALKRSTPRGPAVTDGRRRRALVAHPQPGRPAQPSPAMSTPSE